MLTWISVNYLNLSVASIHNLLESNFPYRASILGGFISYIQEINNNEGSWEELKKFVKAEAEEISLFEAPRPRKPNPHLLKYNIYAPMMSPNVRHFLTIEGQFGSSLVKEGVLREWIKN